MKCIGDLGVLKHIDVGLGPARRKLDVGHHSEKRVPIAVSALGHLEVHEQKQDKLLVMVFVVFFGESLRMGSNERAQHWVSLGLFYTHKHLIWDS